jgi:AcrR family transcriptional regulator
VDPQISPAGQPLLDLLEHRDRVRRRPGGRSARIREAALAATREQLAALGYERLSLDAIAARSGVHRATLHRRWGGKAGLVADAMRELVLDRVPAPDTGSLLEDLRAVIHPIATDLADPYAAALARLTAGTGDSLPEVAAALRTSWAARYERAEVIVAQASARGEVPSDTDPELLAEALIGPLYLRLLITGRPISSAYADRVATVVHAAARCGALRPNAGTPLS